MKNRIKNLWRNSILKSNRGATMVEYALIAALIAVVAITGYTALGSKVDAKAAAVAGNL